MSDLTKEIASIITSSHSGINSRLIVAIDGRCASGKTTLAEQLRQELGCTVFHMDDYFLRPEQRTEKRLNTPGGNVDYERFYSEILQPLHDGADKITFQPYDCRMQSLKRPITVQPESVNIIEGSYSCHPALFDNYDLRIFLTVSPDEQLERIRVRNGDVKLIQFKEKWIPLEECYFSADHVQKHCDISVDTSGSQPLITKNLQR